MDLASLLRWAVEHRATGVLELERNKVCKRIAFRDGAVIGCSSDDPPSRIGQFLLSRGRITSDQLAHALSIHQQTGHPLGSIVQDMGIVEAEELAYELGAKADETLLSLFDWDDAVFRFEAGESEHPWMIDIRVQVDDILERGRRRREEIAAVRRLFVSSGVVLERREVEVPAEVLANGLARGILGTIDGDRTIGEVLYHAHAPEFLVLKLLASAVHSGLIEITGVREPDAHHPTLLDVGPAGEPGDVADLQREPESPPEPAAEPQQAPFEERRELARQFLDAGQVETALDVLDSCYEERPGDGFLGQLIRRAESEFILSSRQNDLRGNLVPVRVPGKTMNLDETPFSTAERFLLGMMGQGRPIQTLLWVAPMREVDIYRALSRMKHAGVIELEERTAEDLEAAGVPAVEWA